MKYLVNLTSNVLTNLSDGNFRGEPRWERNVVSALLVNNKQVHTTRPVWCSEDPIPQNLHNGINEQWLNESTLITHGIGRNLHITAKAKNYIVQFHEPPFEDTQKEFQQYNQNKGIVATTDSKNPFTYNQLVQSLGKENVYFLPGPMVPYTVDLADNFRKPRVLWPYRNFLSFLQERPKDIGALLSFLSPLLANEPEMRIGIVVGIWDTTVFGIAPSNEVIREWVLNFDVMKQFSDLHERIDFYINLDWRQVIALLEETRWIISPAEPLGCPAFEAAIYGIPVIVNNQVNPFMTEHNGTFFPEVLTSDRSVSNAFLGQLSRLQNDHVFYKKHGDAYRNWVRENASYAAYVRDIEEIISQRGW